MALKAGLILLALFRALAVGAAANPLAELQTLQQAGDASPAKVAEALQRVIGEQGPTTTPAAAVYQAFLAGEAYRLADALNPDPDYEQEALKRFREMRITWTDQAGGLMGYLGEARVHRQHGRLDQALAVLRPALTAAPKGPVRQQLELEQAEVYLLSDPSRALALAREVGEAGQWVAARALAALGENEQAVQLAREVTTQSQAPLPDRLRLIQKHGQLNDEEILALAGQLAALQRYEDALAVLAARMPKAGARLRGQLLEQLGRPGEAVAWRRQAFEAEHDWPNRLAEAEDLVAAGEADAAGPVYRAIVASDADDELRQAALSRWAAVAGVDAVGPKLEREAALVAASPYLRYVRAVARLNAGADVADVVSELDAVLAMSPPPNVAAAVVLLLADVQPDARAALRLLDEHAATLASAGQEQRAEALRGALLQRSGMAGAAAEAMLASPDSYEAPALLAAARALAERTRDTGGDATDARRQAAALVDAALRQGGGDDATALDAARILLELGQPTRARQLAASLTGPEARLVEARALRALERPDDALAVLKDAASPEAALERGLVLLGLGQHDPAVAALREARAGLDPRSDVWWTATEALARAHAAAGRTADAYDMLRAARHLHPPQRAAMTQQVDQLLKDLSE